MQEYGLFECHDVTEHAQAIAKFLPGGRAFEAAAIPDTVYNMFLRGIGSINKQAEDFIKLFDTELLPERVLLRHGIQIIRILALWEIRACKYAIVAINRANVSRW